MKIISLFSGAGGMDLGFENAGYNIIWANEFDKTIWETYRKNHNATLDTRSISDITPDEIPDCDGIIGGPPCQSWSLAGSMRGIEDKRGQLVYDYVRILEGKRPKFFLFENVPGILSNKHIEEFKKLIQVFQDIGYDVQYKLLNSADYGIPQIRKRVFIVGIRKDLNLSFDFSKIVPMNTVIPLKEAIGDLVVKKSGVENQEYFEGSFSFIYMSRNRRKNWEEASFTIQASGRHAPLHPDSAEMIAVEKNVREFSGSNVRRLSVRECARIQTFPDSFVFYYDKIDTGYKMVGNAVPVKLAGIIAEEIKNQVF